jgi:CheY-like chemotaxis protein
VEDTAEFMAELAFSKGLRFALWMDHRLPDAVRGDPSRVRQVLTNLLGNAIKFTPRGDVELRATVVGSVEGAADLSFEIRDTGVGIPISAQEKIFEAFTQADGSTTRRFGGSGLGLSISRQLSKLMGGDIRFESEEGVGSRFWFTVRLPIGSMPHPVISPEIPNLSGKNILIVEAHGASRESLSHELEPLQGNCRCVGTAREALEILREATASGNPFHLALLDLQLPDMDGHALSQEIHADKRWKDLHTILLAPLGQRIDSEILRTAGVSGFLVKPIKRVRLYECLRDLVSGGDALALAFQKRTSLAKTVAKVAAPMQLLLVEDNLVNQRVAGAQLRRLGLSPVVANNGLEALEMAANGNYDVILMDCQMPELDGYETTRRIRRAEGDKEYGDRPPHVIIALTANAMAGDRERCLESGMDDFLTKPIELESLRVALVRAGERLGLGSGGLEPEPLALPKSATEMLAASVPVSSSIPPAVAVSLPPELQGEPTLDPKLLQSLRAMQPPEQPDEATELIDLFLSDLGPRLESIVASLKTLDVPVAKAATHGLKGSSGNLGGRRVAAVASLMEQGLKEGSWEPYRNLLPVLRQEVDALRTALMAWRQPESASGS